MMKLKNKIELKQELLTPNNLNAVEDFVISELYSEVKTPKPENKPEPKKLIINPKKILFIDVDGPLIPSRALFLENQGKLLNLGVADTFDPVAVSVINTVLKETKCQFVISSTWRIKRLEVCKNLFTLNKINFDHIHSDWETPMKFSSSRSDEIRMWLDKHLEIEKYAILDDAKVDLPNIVRVSTEDGMQMRHYNKLIELLS